MAGSYRFVMMPDRSQEPIVLAAHRQDAGEGAAREAVEQVWREHGRKLYRSLAAFTGDAELASDAMSEAFAQALGRGDDVRQPERWIWKVAFLLARNELAQRRRRQATELVEPVADMPESVADIVAAMRQLSPAQRMAAILMLYADLPAREAAHVMGCTPATARVHLMNARRRLRPLLENDDV